MCRRNRSNAAGVAPRLPARSTKRGAVIEASGVADSSANGADDPGLPPADHGSTRYSTVSGDVLAANVTQPESVAGSMEVNAATASVSCVPCVPQDGSVPGLTSRWHMRSPTGRPIPPELLSAQSMPLQLRRGVADG